MIVDMNDFYSFFKFIIVFFLILCFKIALLCFEINSFLITIELQIGFLLFFFSTFNLWISIFLGIF